MDQINHVDTIKIGGLSEWGKVQYLNTILKWMYLHFSVLCLCVEFNFGNESAGNDGRFSSRIQSSYDRRD